MLPIPLLGDAIERSRFLATMRRCGTGQAYVHSHMDVGGASGPSRYSAELPQFRLQFEVAAHRHA